MKEIYFKILQYKLLIVLISIFLFSLVLGNYLPVEIKSFLYAISLSIKNILVFLLPIIIFSFLLHSLIILKDKAVSFVILLFSLVAASNFIGIMTGYSVGSAFLPLITPEIELNNRENLTLIPLWRFSLPQFINNEFAMLSGIFLGLYSSFRPNATLTKFSNKLNNICLVFLKKIFLPLLPFFVLGFILKLEYEKILHKAFATYGPVLLLVISAQICYIIIMYSIAANFKFKKFLQYIKNIIPATLTGFYTISSAATMPITIMATEKNLESLNSSRMIISATCNIHTLGSALGLTILALTTLTVFNHPLPALNNFLIFAFFYALAKFAVAGIPGGVIVVVSPLLESYLGFNSEMIGLITGMYLLFDPFGTATNVTCNGAFAIIFNKIYKSHRKDVQIEQEI